MQSRRSSLAPGRRLTRALSLSPALLVAFAWLTLAMHAQVPAAELAKPPADAQVFTILSTSATNGKSFFWTAPDGTRVSRESILVRGQVWEMDQTAQLGSDGMLSSFIVRGITPTADATESFHITAAEAHKLGLHVHGHVPAGMRPSQAIAAGSIVVGKAADLVLVDRDPSKRIGDLRNTRAVMMDGKLMNADALRTASGFSGRPKTLN